jgi:hypothetical protein
MTHKDHELQGSVLALLLALFAILALVMHKIYALDLRQISGTLAAIHSVT